MKIDTSKIPNYAEMPADQRSAIESMVFPDAPDYGGYVKKEVYDKAASEAAKWKKAHNDLLSEDERAKQTRDEQFAALTAEVESLRKEKTISAYAAKYLAEGYDETLAKDTATALADGDMDKVFANQKTFLASKTEAIKKDMLKATPRTPAGSGAAATDYAKRISEAYEHGDSALVAALLREQQESNNR